MSCFSSFISIFQRNGIKSIFPNILLSVIHIQKQFFHIFKGSTKGWSQSECDDRFYSDSKKVCDCKFKQWYQALEKGKCHGAALAMYGIVKAAGSNFYLSSSHDYCNGNSCINDFSEGTSIFWNSFQTVFNCGESRMERFRKWIKSVQS